MITDDEYIDVLPPADDKFVRSFRIKVNILTVTASVLLCELVAILVIVLR
jgi:hypothetical protein